MRQWVDEKCLAFRTRFMPGKRGKIDTFRRPHTCAGCERSPRVPKFLECPLSSFSVFCAHWTHRRIAANNRRFPCHTYHCSSSKCSQPAAPLPAHSCNWASWSKDASREALAYILYVTALSRCNCQNCYFLRYDHPTPFMILGVSRWSTWLASSLDTLSGPLKQRATETITLYLYTLTQKECVFGAAGLLVLSEEQTCSYSNNVAVEVYSLDWLIACATVSTKTFISTWKPNTRRQ